MAAIVENQVDLALQGKPLDSEGTNEVDVLIKVHPSGQGSRTPTHMVCVVDVSGSMSSVATTQDKDGNTQESDGLTYLDVVKHAVRTIIHTLCPDDLFSLVSYSSNATVVLDGVSMSQDGKKKATTALDSLYPSGSTNIWDGLHSGVELVRRNFEKDPNYVSTVMLLTDGQPNIRPPRGEQTMLERYKDEHPDLRCTVNTFGFGYNLDSPLLDDLAKIGNGLYAFIPDSGLVGTVFVNSLSNALSTMVTNTVVALEPANGATISKIHGGYPTNTASWGAEIHLGTCKYGQSRDVVVTMTVPNTEVKYLDTTVTYVPVGSTSAERLTGELVGIDDSLQVDMQKFRCQFVDTVQEAHGICVAGGNRVSDAANDKIAQLVGEITNSRVSGEKEIKGLVDDLTGQVTEALSRQDWYTKWGRHYLPSLIGAHKMQECNNFKDPGVQVYGGDLFEQIQNEADQVFLGLPPPKPSAPRRRSGNHKARAAPVNMARYYNACGGCFDGYGWVKYADGSQKMVKQVKKGDLLLTAGDNVAEVVCVVKTEIEDSYPLVTLESGLKLTPYHPILVDGSWEFPIKVAPCAYEPCDAVYNFVLSNGHVMTINGEEACTLGHGFTDNEVITHPYFGTQKIVKDLKTLQGWSTGLVVLENNCFVRNQQTNILDSLRPGCELSVC